MCDRSHLRHAWCAAGPVYLSHVYVCRGAVQLLRLCLPSVWTIPNTTFSLAPIAYILPYQPVTLINNTSHVGMGCQLFVLDLISICLLLQKVLLFPNWCQEWHISYHFTKQKALSIMMILVVKCTLIFLLQIFYLLARAIFNTIHSYGVGCLVPKMS